MIDSSSLDVGFCKLNRSITQADVKAYFGSICSQYFDLAKKYSEQNGLKALGVDELLLFSLIKTESNCNTAAAAGGGNGLMQLTQTGLGSRYVASKVFDPEYNLDEGTRHLVTAISAIKKKGVTEKQAIILYLFSYNRGIKTTYDAIKYISIGSSVDDAMFTACQDNYSNYGGCAGFDKAACCGRPGTYCRSGVCKSHSGAGLGADYPYKILGFYKDSCLNAGGEMVSIGQVNTSFDSTPHEPASVASGTFDWPTRGNEIISCFGLRPTKSNSGSFHTGVDIAGQIGNPVYAVSDGEIIDYINSCSSDTTLSNCGKRIQYGNSIAQKTSEGYFVYAHLNDVYVKSGNVKKGQIIGAVGISGYTNEPHLHLTYLPNVDVAFNWSWSKNNSSDPMCLLKDFSFTNRRGYLNSDLCT